MSLQIVAVKEDVGFNRPQLRNVSFNASNQVVYIVDQQTRQFLYYPFEHNAPEQGPQLLVVSSSLVLTIRKLNLWELTRVALITLHYRQCSTQSHGLHTVPSPVASNNAACPRWKIANQDSESTTGGTPSSTVKYTVASGLFRQIEDKTKVAADERAPSRLPPSSPPPSHYCGVLNLWHRDTFIHHRSAMSIASGFLTRVYCLNKLSCAPQRGFFEASADCDELECDVAWLVTALQRVVRYDNSSN
ncbi:hypothetical protein EN45_002010 [Penicillium chrysogenum]|uniref:Uncharacterized protein n=1 Tax=Penicillium chrysogenum TaxID=5076 RepID=A0A167V746_PENCH|nr:hypothetical protein EN45_002010 [Penicillium chrysogenum]